jgi:predicted O-methyltransferase YrrM
MNLSPYLNTNCWFDYPNFYMWLASQNNISLIAEVGSWKGHSTSFLAKEMLKTRNEFKIYAIDIWEKWEQYTIFEDSQKELLNEVRQSHDIFKKNIELANVQDYVIDIQADSHQGHMQFDDEYFDCVFLDADHKYEVVKKDIDLWYNKVRKGGILAGHDYNQKSCGVKQAVDERFNNANIVGQVWYIYK